MTQKKKKIITPKIAHGIWGAKLVAARNKKIAGLIRQGKETGEIATAFNISVNRVWEVAKKNGLSTPFQKRQKEWKKKNSEIIVCLKKGLSNKQIRAKFKVSSNYVVKVRSANKIPLFLKMKLAARNKKIIQLIKRGVPTKKIAAEMKLTVINIYKISRRNGMSIQKIQSRIPR